MMNNLTGKALSLRDHVRQSIADILTTPIGSRVCRRDYGSHLPDLIDQPLNGAGIQAIYAATALAIGRFEPRFTITKIAAQLGESASTLILNLTGYARDAASQRSALVSFSIPISRPAWPITS